MSADLVATVGALTKRATAVMALAAAMLLGAMDAVAQEKKEEEKEKGPNTGRISISAGIDVPTDYYFRGIKQETAGYIIQPYGDLAFKLWDGVPIFSNLALTIGTWNSLHGGPTGTDGPNADPEAWYESDFYTKVGWTMFGDVSAGLIYTAYMSPNDFFDTVQELAVSLGFNDSKYTGRLLEGLSLNPSVLVAFEVKGQADAGAQKGVYMQLGLTPTYTFNTGGAYPITVTTPLLAGLSLGDYYEFGTGDDTTSGYFQGGVGLAVPLAFIPSSFGSWQLKTGVNFLRVNGNLKDVNSRDRNEVIGTVGIAFTY
jgi:hypothetical protein